MADDRVDDGVVAALRANASERLQAANGHPDALRDAIMSYIVEGYRVGLCSSELIDFFCVSTANILETAGYHGSGAADVVAVFDVLHDQFRHKGR
jgi:hypothetical protein